MLQAITKKFPDLFELVTGDIRNPEHLKEMFQKNRVDFVVHLAARAGVRPSLADPLLYQDVNIRGTIVLLEACREHGIQNFIFASSSSVYGENQRVPFSEKDLDIQPISPYGATKRAGELLCYSYHHLYGMNISCLRFFTAYGPRQRPEMAIHKFTRLIDRGEKIPIYGDGSSRRDYTYIEDIIDGMIGAIRYHKGFEIYNLGESQTTSLKELIRLIEEAIAKKANIERLKVPARGCLGHVCGHPKAKRMLKYQPKVKMKEGIKRFVEWYKKGK